MCFHREPPTIKPTIQPTKPSLPKKDSKFSLLPYEDLPVISFHKISFYAADEKWCQSARLEPGTCAKIH